MKSQLSWQALQNLEARSQQNRPSSLWSKINDAWQTISAYLAASSEPHVWISQDAAGLTQWKAYDPMTRQAAEYSSEAEMRAWLEERHYQYHRLTR